MIPDVNGCIFLPKIYDPNIKTEIIFSHLIRVNCLLTQKYGLNLDLCNG